MQRSFYTMLPKPLFHVSADANVIRKRKRYPQMQTLSANANIIRKCKRNHHPMLSVIMSYVFPCIRFN